MVKKGFTLIELIVVIAIIGILSLLFIPTIVSYFDETKDTSKGGYSQSTSIEEPKIVNQNNNLKCVDGKKVIELNGEVFHLGKIKNSWGDLESIDCQ